MIKPTREEFLDFSPLDDDMLLQLIEARQIKGWEAFYDRYSPYVYGAAICSELSPQEAEEIVEKVFLRVWSINPQHIPSLENFPIWFETILADYLSINERVGFAQRATIQKPVPKAVKDQLLEKIMRPAEDHTTEA